MHEFNRRDLNRLDLKRKDRPARRCAARARLEQGYVLLTLLLFAAVLAIGAAAVAPRIAFEIKRDREEELVHRGAEYTRAIQRFAKANARYPLRLEELQSTGGLKYIRKLYKDPITGGDFRLLYMSDIPAASGVSIAGGQGLQGNAQWGGNLVATQAPAAQPFSSTGDNSNSDPSSAGTPSTSGTPTAGSASENSASNGGNEPNSKGAIIGVVSKSTARSIREFDKKNHYNDWLFFYLPSYNTGRRINGPTPLTLPPAAALNGTGGQNQVQGQANAQASGQN